MKKFLSASLLVLLFSFLVSGLAGSLFASPVHAADVTLYNPLGETDVRIILGTVIKGFLSIIGSLALVMFIYGGMFWLTSAGNPDRIKKGREIIVWATLGLVVVFAAYAIVSALINALTTGSATAL